MTMNPSDRLAVTVCATEAYQYAMTAQARTIHANLRHLEIPICIILAGDDKLKGIEDLYKQLFESAGDRVTIERIPGFKATAGRNYKNEAQLLIAQMRTAAFARARSFGATHCWSLDSDVIPKTSNCFRTLAWILEIPDRYYEVAISPYPSQGGGDVLTGRGSPESPIFEDYKQEERKIPEDLAKRIAAHKANCEAIKPPAQPSKALLEEGGAIREKIQECEPIAGVFELNAKFGWRRRGWLMSAYPGLGRGVIVPSDWCGFGSTLMSRRALDECDFCGYEGGGTEDLYIVWNHWHQVGIRIGSALHEPSSHVSRRKDGKFFMSWIRFVTDADESKGECVGHMRTLQRPFYAQDKGEKYDADNDGNPIPPADRVENKNQVTPAAGVPIAKDSTKADAAPAVAVT